MLIKETRVEKTVEIHFDCSNEYNTIFLLFLLLCFQGIQRLYEEGEELEEADEGVGEEPGMDEEQEEEEEDEEERERDGCEPQSKDSLLPERRSRRLKSEVNDEIAEIYHVVFVSH